MNDNALTRHARRGAAGETLSPPGLIDTARRNDPAVVIASYVGFALVSAVISVTTLSTTLQFVLGIASYIAWGFLALFYLAIGTPTARGFAIWGIGLVGAILAVVGAFSALFTIFTYNAVDTFMATLEEYDLAPSRAGYVGRFVVFTIFAVTYVYGVVQLAKLAPEFRAYDQQRAQQQSSTGYPGVQTTWPQTATPWTPNAAPSGPPAGPPPASPQSGVTPPPPPPPS